MALIAKVEKPADSELDAFHYFAVMDRTSVMLDAFIAAVGEHPATLQTEEILIAYQAAEAALRNLYQVAGKRALV